jgi:alanine dehydrogenase
MVVGVPTEIKDDENRVAIAPSRVASFSAHEHSVVVRSGAGSDSAISGDHYRASVATVLETTEEV